MKNVIKWGVLLVIALLAGPAKAQETTAPLMQFGLQNALFKLKPGSLWEKAEPLGSGTCDGGGCDSSFDAMIDGVSYKIRSSYDVNRDGPFNCTVSVEPETSATGKISRQIQIPISDLQSTTVELLRQSDGTALYYSFMPTVSQSVSKEPTLAAKGDYLTTWNLDSLVLLDDRSYVGRLKMTGGPAAWLDIAGVGKLIFSLNPFGNAKPIGTLTDDSLIITGPGNQKVELTNVKLGNPGVILPGGPYKVFVEWADLPKETLRPMIAAIKQRLDSTTSINNQATKDFLARLERGDPAIVGNGVGPASIARHR